MIAGSRMRRREGGGLEGGNRPMSLRTTSQVRGLVAAVAAALFVGAGAAQAASPVEGRIVGFECGDNCYLQITTDKGKDVNALCSVGPCEKWAENAEMPAKFVGRKVEGTLGKGMRYDGDGNPMGGFPAFETLKLK